MRWPTSWTTWRLSQSRGGLARRYSLQLARVLDSLEVYIPSPSECLAPGRASPGERGRRPQTIRLSGPRQSFTFIRSMSCTIERHPQTLRGSGPRQSFKFSRSMPWTTWRSTSTNSLSVWPQTELGVQTAHVFYTLETPTDPQRVWLQTELQVQMVHVLDNVEVYIHKLSEHLVPGRELPDTSPTSPTTWD